MPLLRHRRLARDLAPLIVALAVALTASAAQAAAQRTFVSPNGFDTNTSANCSLAAPCRSFGAAITVTNANGEIIVLDSAGYGAVVINKSVSIISPPGIYAGVSVLAGEGVTMNTAGIEVTLKGLTINGQGGTVGIHFTQGSPPRDRRVHRRQHGPAGHPRLRYRHGLDRQHDGHRQHGDRDPGGRGGVGDDRGKRRRIERWHRNLDRGRRERHHRALDGDEERPAWHRGDRQHRRHAGGGDRVGGHRSPGGRGHVRRALRRPATSRGSTSPDRRSRGTRAASRS